MSTEARLVLAIVIVAILLLGFGLWAKFDALEAEIRLRDARIEALEARVQELDDGVRWVIEGGRTEAKRAR